MKIPIYQVDAFAEKLFKGNPAAVCILEQWLPDNILQSIAAENNLAETAFLVMSGSDYHLRWFTPAVEIDLCGHATLATAHVLFTILQPSMASVTFQSKSGPLTVTRNADLLTLDFPARPPRSIPVPAHLLDALGRQPEAVLMARDILVVYKDEEEIRSLKPDIRGLLQVKEAFGVIATAPGIRSDFVSRFFAPKEGIPEDPVTGSAHCTLIPYWAERLNKLKLHARQLSERGGELFCELCDDRVKIGGKALLYLKGEIDLGI